MQQKFWHKTRKSERTPSYMGHARARSVDPATERILKQLLHASKLIWNNPQDKRKMFTNKI